MGMLDCYEEILKEKNKSLPRHAPVLDLFLSFSGAHESPLLLLGIEGDPGDRHTVQEEVPPT
jgi:hypothetical protein